MMECPKCHYEIADHAKYCGCGWKKPNPFEQLPAYRVHCAHADCAAPAICRIKVPTGWANLCDAHYDQHFLNQGNATCDRLGLDTPAKKRQYVLEKARNMFKMREPGEDEDYKALIRDFSTLEGSQP